MSMEYYSIVRKSNVPSRDTWQNAIDAIGMELTLDPNFEPFVDEGFLPFIHKGEECGFEIYYEPAKEIGEQFPTLVAVMGDRDHSISFRLSGADDRDVFAASIAAAALIRCADAVVIYEDGIVMGFDELINDAKAMMSEL